MDASTPISKMEHPHYLKLYQEHLASFGDRPFVILEIGIANGDSLYYWRDHYPNATIIGIDMLPFEAKDDSGRIHTYQGMQQDTDLLDKIAKTHAPNGIDVVIDDGSHIGHYTRLTFWHLIKNHMRAGSFYFIEDWGTGYWPMYPDGKAYRGKKIDATFSEKFFGNIAEIGFVKSNNFLSKVAGKLRYLSMQRKFPSTQHGMVGFIKELIDEAGIADATDPRYGCPPQRSSIFEWMRISVGHVVIKRADD